ncbi:MAG: THO complex subunit 2, partial [Paramarteilia canceri]
MVTKSSKNNDPSKIIALQEQNEKVENLDFNIYIQLYKKWQINMTKNILNVFESGKDILIRSYMIFLIETVSVYPSINSMGTAIEIKVKKLISEYKEKRKDIHTLATIYSGLIHQNKSRWISDDKFKDIAQNSTASLK